MASERRLKSVAHDETLPILNALKEFYGFKSPVKSEVLQENFGISGREVRTIINHLRTEHPIGSGDGGYFYAKTQEELEPTFRRIEATLATVKTMIFNLRTSQKKLPRSTPATEPQTQGGLFE